MWTRHATSAAFFASPYRDSVSTSCAAASPAKSETFDGATPSSQCPVSPISSTSSRYSACALNRDQVARWAGFFSRLNTDRPSVPAVASSPRARSRPSGPIRDTMPAKIASLTSARIVVAMSSSVEYAGSSSEASMMRSSAMLIRSGGWFRTSAASRIAASASALARRMSRVAPSRLRTWPLCHRSVRAEVSRRNCGYAVRSIDVTRRSPDPDEPGRQHRSDDQPTDARKFTEPQPARITLYQTGPGRLLSSPLPFFPYLVCPRLAAEGRGCPRAALAVVMVMPRMVVPKMFFFAFILD
jgi:hypothetical protein